MTRVTPLLILLTCLLVPGPAAGQVENARTESDRPEIFQVGYAYRYADVHDGRRTASGEIYSERAMTAAHRTLPIGARVKVENIATGANVVVRINDRGPYVEGRIIDVSMAAARILGVDDNEYVMVRLVEVEPAADVETQTVTAIDVSRTSYTQNVTTKDSDYFTVQLGSYSDGSSANELASRFDEAWVQEIEVNSKTVFRVNFGVYSNRSSAERARLQLTQAEGFVKQVDGDPPIERIQ
ncbi:MAG: septal ring lytic transglycosylase RlpA family protein [Rhodothermales bacterium]|nr:septal ring lytic transglycosylase RlpA family protein [Rhodothermales bacterium]